MVIQIQANAPAVGELHQSLLRVYICQQRARGSTDPVDDHIAVDGVLRLHRTMPDATSPVTVCRMW
jgi:hypothetical protein